MAIDQDKLNDFLGKFVADFGATFHAGMVVIGEKLGLYKALAKKPMTPKELAAATSTDERYVREWLSSQAAGGYVSYNPLTRAFSLSEEQAFTLAEEGGPAYLPGAFELALAALKAVPRITEAFKTGRLRARRFHHPASRAQEGAACLGAQAGEHSLKEIVNRGGFTKFRRATQTPFNRVFEARP